MFKTQYKNIKINMNFYFMIIKIVSIKNKNDLKKLIRKFKIMINYY
jgi:hypothetical protein